METLRTPYPLTEEDQSEFLQKLDRNKHRYWLVYEQGLLTGMGGITNIQWENRIGEISLLIDPANKGCGYGSRAVELILSEAFGNMGLRTVFGECYMSNSASKFWRKMKEKYSGMETILPNRKLWKGVFYDSLYFSIDADSFVF